jgi:hypothetical protein
MSISRSALRAFAGKLFLRFLLRHRFDLAQHLR